MWYFWSSIRFGIPRMYSQQWVCILLLSFTRIGNMRICTPFNMIETYLLSNDMKCAFLLFLLTILCQQITIQILLFNFQFYSFRFCCRKQLHVKMAAPTVADKNEKMRILITVEAYMWYIKLMVIRETQYRTKKVKKMHSYTETQVVLKYANGVLYILWDVINSLTT